MRMRNLEYKYYGYKNEYRKKKLNGNGNRTDIFTPIQPIAIPAFTFRATIVNAHLPRWSNTTHLGKLVNAIFHNGGKKRNG